MVRRTRRALEHLALVVRAVGHLHLRSNLLDLLRRELGTARLAEIAIGQKPHRMAVGADLAIDLEAALELGVVVSAERGREAPALMGDLWRLIDTVLRRCRAWSNQREDQCEKGGAHHRTSSRARARAGGFGGVF